MWGQLRELCLRMAGRAAGPWGAECGWYSRADFQEAAISEPIQ
jgi:hypothetical protein